MSTSSHVSDIFVTTIQAGDMGLNTVLKVETLAAAPAILGKTTAPAHTEKRPGPPPLLPR